jgi:hypothetical protein
MAHTILFAQVPPTPTPFIPESFTGLSIPTGYNIWYFADDAVGQWNAFGEKGQVLQIAAIVAIVIISMMLIVRYFHQVRNESRFDVEE